MIHVGEQTDLHRMQLVSLLATLILLYCILIRAANRPRMCIEVVGCGEDASGRPRMVYCWSTLASGKSFDDSDDHS